LSLLDRQAEFPNHVEELRDLVRLGFPVSWLMALRARQLGMRLKVMTAGDRRSGKPKFSLSRRIVGPTASGTCNGGEILAVKAVRKTVP